MHRCGRLAPTHRAWPVALLLAALPASSCATDEDLPPARIGAQPVPVSSPGGSGPGEAGTESSLGEGGDASASATGSPAAGSRGAAREAPRTAFIYNRVLAKLADPAAVDVERLRAAVEARTGAKVKQIKRGPLGLLSIVFEDVTPARGEAEQRALVDKLKGMQELRYAEPERLLQAR